MLEVHMRAPALAVLATAIAAGCSGTDRVDVRQLEGAVAVSAVAEPVAVSGVAQPVQVSAVAQPVAVSAIAAPVAVSSVAEPLSLVRPEFDPERIESGDGASGVLFSCMWSTGCRELATGPFVLTDVVTSFGASVRFSAGASFDYPRWRFNVSESTVITGTRFAVRAGEKLYLEPVAGTVAWSGFRP